MATATSLLAEVNSLAVRTHGPRTSGVTLATLHKAKGLEWDIVFVVGMTDGAMPSTYAESEAELAEEERLLHVGVTRARRELHLTWATSNARGWTNHPSPFLDRLAARRSSGATVTRGADAAAATAQRAERHPSDAKAASVATAQCPHCAGPLKGIAARRLAYAPIASCLSPGKRGKWPGLWRA